MSEYRTWEDFLDTGLAGEPDGEAVGVPSSVPDALSEQFQAFLREHDRLRLELDRRTGTAQPTPEEARLAAMYPVMVHTPESRIQERLLRKRDENQLMLKRQALARRRMAEAEEAREAEARALAERERERHLRVLAVWEQRRAQQQEAAADRRRAEQRVQKNLDDRIAGALEKRNEYATLSGAIEWERRRDATRERYLTAKREETRREATRRLKHGRI